jgi:hypothetical protein
LDVAARGAVREEHMHFVLTATADLFLMDRISVAERKDVMR